jgi:hypothetical protein
MMSARYPARTLDPLRGQAYREKVSHGKGVLDMWIFVSIVLVAGVLIAGRLHSLHLDRLDEEFTKKWGQPPLSLNVSQTSHRRHSRSLLAILLGPSERSSAGSADPAL